MKTSTDNHWSERARSVKDDIEVNIMDIFQRNLEYAAISRWLKTDMRLLEVGCGNGFSTEVFAGLVKNVDAFDYSEEMVGRAQARVNRPNVRFFHDNILSPTALKPDYDAIVCVRVLINLRDLAEQKLAIRNMSSHLKPGGQLILVEGFTDGFHALTRLRAKVGLPAVEPAKINFYASVDEVKTALTDFSIEDEFHLGSYDYLTRIFYPLMVGPAEAKSNTVFSEKAAELAAAFNPPEMSELSRLRGFLLQKKS